MRRHHSIAETLAALDYDGEVPYRATVYLARLREHGLAAATTYLATKVSRVDRAEVLRFARAA